LKYSIKKSTCAGGFFYKYYSALKKFKPAIAGKMMKWRTCFFYQLLGG
jgi:hypothetical protein